MNRNRHILSNKLALASLVVMSMAAAPVAVNSDLLPQSNAASAQDGDGTASEVDRDGVASEQDGDEAASEQDLNGAAGAQDRNGHAMERTEEGLTGGTTEAQQDVYDILGTTREQAEQADSAAVATSRAGPLRNYQEAVERDRLDAAAENLANISNRPVTEQLVTDVNTALGVETRLTAQQIAEAAASKQDSAY